ncbi:MAG: hypothetical protein IPM97_16475 [Bdellovibrionaceae bacterium]|nr:hypothetical protein [Pseudobdellovibrionaceae bacterium]
MRFMWIILFISMNLSCSLLQRQETNLAVRDPEQLEMQKIEGALKAGLYQEVVLLTESFQSEYPYSLRLQRARYYRASALEGLERWSEASAIYQIISKFSGQHQPEISALSVYRLSFVYEALGDDQRVLTTLLEAREYQDHLPAEIVVAEIPSRIAMIYAKESNSAEAARWLVQAEKGLKQVFDIHNGPLTDNWLAKIYFNMGSISTNQLSADNILAIIQGQLTVQKYLIRSLQFNDETWSARAQLKLQKIYLDLWTSIDGLVEPSGYDALVAAKIKRDEQLRLAVPFLELIKDAQLYHPFREGVTNEYQKKFFEYLDSLQGRVELLLQSPIYTPRVAKPNKKLPMPKNPIKVVPSEDPNL